MKTLSAVAVCLVLLALPAALAADDRRPLRTQDVYALKDVRDPQVSPAGDWVAFTVRSLDAKSDRRDTDVWMVPMAGGPALRLTSSPKSESRPRFSPDGRYLAFLSGREGDKTQVWLLDRRGGEALKLTDFKADVSDLAWSPDGKRLALVVSDVDPDDTADTGDKSADGEAKTPKPIVIHRLQFKRDREGYLNELRSHLYVFEVATKASVQITSGAYDDEAPTWSPDGALIAFTSNRTAEPDSNDNSDIYVVAPRAGETPRAITTSPGADTLPSFSPDGKWIVYAAGGAPEDIWYAPNAVAVAPVSGGAPRLLTAALDRNVDQPRFSADGTSILFLLEEGGTQHLARIPAAGGEVARLVDGERVVSGYSVGAQGGIAALESQTNYPPEISALDGHGLRRLTTINDDFLRGIRLAPVQRIKATSADGQQIDGFLTLPADAVAGQRLPAVLRIHGGPASQFASEFMLEWQILAGHGFAVIAANPRGSTGYGRAFSRAIWADWGNKDAQDVLAMVDRAVALGYADPARLGVGGWSYGGILTNCLITQSSRFKAATTGASETNYLANYGTDHYQKEWEAELGLPWQHADLWLRLSPFYKLEKITTPTLVLCGGADVNVPCLNSEQLFQGLRRLGRTSELVVYPGQYHEIDRPSYIKDRLDRYLAWYDKYLQAGAPSASATARP